MLSDRNVVDALMSSVSAPDRVIAVSSGVELATGDEIHLGYLPIGRTELSDWRSAAIRSGYSIVSESDREVAFEGAAKSTERIITASMVTGSEPGLAAFIAVGRRADCRDAYEMIERHVRPAVARPTLRQHNFAAIFSEISRHLGARSELYFKRLSARRWITREQRESTMTWTDLPFRQAFSEARDQGKFFRHVTFEVRVGKSPTSISGGLSRPNLFSMSQAAAPRLTQVVSKQLVNHARNEIKLVTDRSRATPSTVPRPVIASFEAPLFSNELEIRKIRDHFHNYKNSSIAVIHGNPYFHARIVDLTDGSSYAVFVTASDSMLLIPQLWSSEPSFGRLLEFVHDSFGDVQFKDAPRAYA